MKIIECPRDAMQGLHDFIPTTEKARYLNALLQVGFDSLDFGSFVSPKAIPQMKDTAEVLEQLDLTNTKSKLLTQEYEIYRVKAGDSLWSIAQQFQTSTAEIKSLKMYFFLSSIPRKNTLSY